MRRSRTQGLAAVVALVILAVIGIVWFRGQRTERAAVAADAGIAAPVGARAPGAAPPRTTPAAPAAAVAAVSGTVRSLLDGSPVAEVGVLFRGPTGESTAHSDDAGAFSLELAPGTYDMRAVGDRFASFGGRTVIIAGDTAGLDIEVVELARVRGRVVRNGGPVPDVRVHHLTNLLGASLDSSDTEPAGEAASGSDGGFELRVPPGAVEVIASPDQGPEARVLLPWVEPGAELSGVILQIPAGVSVAGGVLDPAGRPVAGATVHATGERESRTAITAAGGSFTFEDLPAGELRFEARAEGFAPTGIAVLEAPDGERRSGLILRLGEAAVIAGRVLDHQGQPVAGAQVSARRATSTLPPVTTTSATDGVFRFADLARGPFALEARAEGHAPARLSGVHAPAGGLELRLPRHGAITGTVSAGDRPVPVFTVALRLGAFDGPLGPALPEPVRFAGSGGRYRLDELEPGTYEVVISAPGRAPSVLRGVEVPAGGEAVADAELGPGAAVAGTVSAASGAPIAGATVRLSTGHEGEIAYTDRSGRYAIGDIAPGRRSLEVEHPTYVRRMVTGLVLEAGRTRTVDVTLTPAGPGAGRPLELAGIGAVLRVEDGRLMVIEPVAGGPSEAAGLRAGDEIVSIDGALAAELSFADSVELLRGVVGTSVRLAIGRPGEPTRIVDVVRQLVRIEN